MSHFDAHVSLGDHPTKIDHLSTMTLVETPRSIDKLKAQITRVHTPSVYLVTVDLGSSDYPHSAPTDKQ